MTGSDNNEKKCPECNGSGLVTFGAFLEPCPRCGGLCVETPKKQSPTKVEAVITHPTPTGTKPRPELLEVELAEVKDGIIEVLTFGISKHGYTGWKKLTDNKDLKAALHRHLNAYYRGELTDSETGLSHLYHATANLLMLADLEVQNAKRSK